MLAVLLQLAPPALQVTGMHFQRARHFDHALRTVQSAYRRLLEIFGEFSARLLVPVSPFNDFQRLTGCLKNGVHSINRGFSFTCIVIVFISVRSRKPDWTFATRKYGRVMVSLPSSLRPLAIPV